jgi:tetratricopeptide (TPR) repeat protein
MRHIFKIAMVLSLVFGFSECSLITEESKPDPLQTLLQYRQFRSEWKLHDLYSMLADTCKTFISEEEFINYIDQPDSIKQNRMYNMVSSDTLPVFGNEDYVRYKVAYQFIDKKEKDTLNGFWYYSLYFENGNWKVIWFSKLMNLGFHFLQNQQFEQSNMVFQVITGVNPYDETAFRGLALSYASLLNMEEAIDATKRLIELMPDADANYALLADLYGSADRYAEAIENYEKAISINPDPVYFINMGSIYKMDEQFVEADESYRKSLELDSLLPQSWWMLGELYFHNLDDPESARIYFEKALDLPPMSDYYQQQLYYGYALLLFNEAMIETEVKVSDQRSLYREALNYVKQAREIDPQNTDYLFLLNEINLKLQKI